MNSAYPLVYILGFTILYLLSRYVWPWMVRRWRDSRHQSFARRVRRLRSEIRAAGTELTLEEAPSCLERVLGDLGCQYEKTESENTLRYSYDYQGGHFVIHLSNDKLLYYLFFGGYFSAPTSQERLVARVCNEVNAYSSGLSSCYAVNHAMSTIVVSAQALQVITYDHSAMHGMLASLMSSCFELQRDFHEQFAKAEREQAIEESGEARLTPSDMVLLCESELRLQEKPLPFRPNETRRLTLGQLVRTCYGWPDFQPLRLRISGGPQEAELTDAASIVAFDLASVLMAHNVDGGYYFAADAATLLLDVRPSTEASARVKRTLVVVLRAHGEGPDTFYVMVNVVLLPLEDGGNVDAIGLPSGHTDSYSFVVPFDTRTDAQRQREFDYLWTEACDKLAAGRASELTDDQRLMAQVQQRDVAASLFRGMSLFRDRHFYPALLHFENAWHELTARYDSLSEAEHATLFNVTYRIGACYNALGMPRQAYYYLEVLVPHRNIDATMEYVNALIALDDQRAPAVVDNLLRGLNEAAEKSPGQLPPPLRYFVGFLHRSQVRIALSRGRLDAAEQQLKQMLSEADNADYALTLLAQIQRQRREAASAKPESQASESAELAHKD